MKVDFDQSFLKSLKKVNDKKAFQKLKVVIHTLEGIENLSLITDCKKLSGFKTYYRIRIGNYRLGFEELSKNHIRLITFLHRKDIYKKFP